MLAEIEVASDILSVADSEKLVVAFVSCNQFCVVEKRNQIAAGLKISTKIDETVLLLQVLCVKYE